MNYIKWVFLLCLTQSYGQHVISKQFMYNHELIVVEFEEIDELRIEQAENSILTIEMEGQIDKLTSIDVRQSAGLILISGEEMIDITTNSIDKYCRIQPLYNVYTLKIPKGAALEVYYTEGNFKAHQFSGNLKLSLERGNVSLGDIYGNFEIDVYAGNVTARLKNTAFDVDTNLGKFSTDLSVDQYTEKSHHYTGVYGNPKNFLKVKTIRANIDLKAAENQ